MVCCRDMTENTRVGAEGGPVRFRPWAPFHLLKSKIIYCRLKFKERMLGILKSAAEIDPTRTLGLRALSSILGGVHMAELHRHHINLEKGVLGKGKEIPSPADNLTR